MIGNLIIESTIFQEAQIQKLNPSKCIYRMVLQTCDEINQNKRLYPKRVLVEGMEDCRERMKRRAFFGELDHPLPMGNSSDGIRQTTVLLKEVSHIIRDFEFRNNMLHGELETTDTPNGRILLGLLKDKAGIGISMRGMAELDRGDISDTVMSPLTIIGYDIVSNPSHRASLVNFNEMTFESKSMLQESCNGNLVCTPDGKCYLSSYFDKLVEQKIIKFTSTWV